jgi:long-chain acyl-CoA synthetase
MSALSQLGVSPKSTVGVYGINSPEWFLTMQALSSMSAICVPIYDTMGEENVEYVISHSESCAVAVQDTKLSPLAKILAKGNCSNITSIVYWGNPSEEAINEMKQALGSDGSNIVSYDRALEMGKSKPMEHQPPNPEDLTTIMYTSGTTGEPKGVMLTHSSVLAQINAVVLYTQYLNLNIGSDDVLLSYLPLAHIMDRVIEETMIACGACIVYWRGDIKNLMEDIKIIKPTILPGVPRVFDRVYSKAMSQVQSSAMKRCLYNIAFNNKRKRLDCDHVKSEDTHLWNHLIFNKMKSALGGNVKVIISGAAPLAQHVEDFLRISMCCPVVQGYGLTETNASSFMGICNDSRSTGTVGPPMPSTLLRLESIPEMEYDAHADPPRGEVIIGGPTMFSGYYKKDDETKKSTDDDGYFHTGDVGELTPEGFLRIIDRKKNIFKLAQGEYIAVEKLENTYGQAQIVDSIWIHGNSFHTYLVAVAVPNEEKLRSATGAGQETVGFEELCKRETAKNAVVDELGKVAEKEGLKGLEKVKKVHLEPEAFSVESNLLTPTFKKKRPQLQKWYQQVIEEMYKDNQ